MIGHVLVGTNDLDRARRFYDALLGAVGAGRTCFPRSRRQQATAFRIGPA